MSLPHRSNSIKHSPLPTNTAAVHDAEDTALLKRANTVGSTHSATKTTLYNNPLTAATAVKVMPSVQGAFIEKKILEDDDAEGNTVVEVFNNNYFLFINE